MADKIINIKRISQTKDSTISRYEMPSSNISGFILERPGPDTTEVNLRLRIPEGFYRLKWHNSNIRSVRPFNPVPLIYNENVSISRFILIHNGNYPVNTDGCLLIGGSRGVDFVGGSVVKLQELKTLLQSEGIEKFRLSIKSCYSDCN
ncbi:DUF5675 family protein [Winslowiella iniecta]|uniref:DUF5675 family protein n=1 Tax=Winslowiella iniecta TaxID=1560201 RepID=UPI00092D3CA7|nr:DUF5675 family protein [Winslowiella iniecta]